MFDVKSAPNAGGLIPLGNTPGGLVPRTTATLVVPVVADPGSPIEPLSPFSTSPF